MMIYTCDSRQYSCVQNNSRERRFSYKMLNFGMLQLCLLMSNRYEKLINTWYAGEIAEELMIVTF